MDPDSKLDLVRRNTSEILTEEELRVLLETKSNPVAYDGITVTGPFHMGYLIPFGKMLDFDKAGIKNKILVADVHSAMDDLKAPWEQLDKRSEYYQKCIELSFPWERTPEFIRGSEFQYDKDYVKDLFKMATLATVARSTRAASEVTRMKNPKVSELVYPIMQALDEEYLGVDIQLGGIDQRHILAFAREYLPKLGYRPRVEIMTPLILSLKGSGAKMSASIRESHIRVYDSEDQIKKKITNAYCPEGQVEDNPIIQLSQYIVFPIMGQMKIERETKFGGDVAFENLQDLQDSYLKKELHPSDLKNALARELTEIFSRAREFFSKNRAMLAELGEEFV